MSPNVTPDSYAYGDLPAVLSAEDMARLFRVGLSGARRMMIREFRHVKMGKRNFVMREDFLAGIATKSEPPSAPNAAALRFDSGLRAALRRHRPRIPARKAGADGERASSASDQAENT